VFALESGKPVPFGAARAALEVFDANADGSGDLPGIVVVREVRASDLPE